MKIAARPIKYVSVGDSLTAGFEDIALSSSSQSRAFPSLVADKLQVDFKPAALPEAGAPPNIFHGRDLHVETAAARFGGFIGSLLPAAGALAFGFNPGDMAMQSNYWQSGVGVGEEVQNLGVAGFEMRHLDGVKKGDDVLQEIADSVLPLVQLALIPSSLRAAIGTAGKSALELAIGQQPDLLTFWAGGNDVLQPCLQSSIDDQTLTPMEDRVWTLPNGQQTNTVMPGLKTSFESATDRLLKETEAEVVVMNIPDVTEVPYLFEVGQPIGELPFRIHYRGQDYSKEIEQIVLSPQVKGESDREQFPAGSKVGLKAVLRALPQAFKEQGAMFTEGDVLDPEELQMMRDRTSELNALIESTCEEQERLHLVDVASLMDQAKSGLELRGEGEKILLKNDYAGLSEGYGFFSKDGIHPSEVGHTVIANRILDVVKTELADKPKFARYQNLEGIDEKKVLKRELALLRELDRATSEPPVAH